MYDNTELQNFIAEVLEDARLRIASDSPLCEYNSRISFPTGSWKVYLTFYSWNRS